MAASNTSRTPSLVFAEHSRYLWALMVRDISSPSAVETGFCLMRASSAKTSLSARRSAREKRGREAVCMWVYVGRDKEENEREREREEEREGREI